MPRSGHSEHPAGVRHQFGMLSAFSVERCPPSRWNTVRHQRGIVSAIAWNTQSGLVTLCGQLHELRSVVGRSLIAEFESFINSLVETPREFDRTFALYHINLQQFDQAGKLLSENLEQEIRSAATIGGATAGLGAAAGAATAFGAPTAAMAVATTFGTSSTGIAISTLSGAAATKAALAWLGGGALTAGGTGIAGGNALLALAGPIGWALAGGSLAAGIGWTAYKNRATIEDG